MEKKTQEPKMNDLQVSVSEDFCNFIKEYMGFFGINVTVEEFCRDLVYDRACYLHRELTKFAEEQTHFIDSSGADWHNRFSHIDIVSDQDC